MRFLRLKKEKNNGVKKFNLFECVTNQWSVQKIKKPKVNRLSEFISESPKRWKTNATRKL